MNQKKKDKQRPEHNPSPIGAQQNPVSDPAPDPRADIPAIEREMRERKARERHEGDRPRQG